MTLVGIVFRCLLGDVGINILVFFFSSRRRHTRSLCDWSSDVCSSDLRKFSKEILDEIGLTNDIFGALAEPGEQAGNVIVDRKSVV